MAMRRHTLMTILLLLMFTLSGCGDLLPVGIGDANAVTITIAYSPEKEKWLTEQIARFNEQRVIVNDRRVVVEGINKSSGAARTEIKNGTLQVTVWSPSASTWLEVLKQETGNQNVAISNKPLVLTPVVIAMWKPMAEAMGWPNRPIGWKDILDLTNDPQGWGRFGHPEWGRFSWGHTDPEISTTALSTLIAEFYAATGKREGLTVADVQSEQATAFIRQLGRSIKHYGYNTLIFSENMKKFGMSYISAFPMEEITLIDFNKFDPPPTPLVAIYPAEGTFWHDNPFIVMASTSADEQAAAERFYEFLLSEESQRAAMQYGFRPANPNVPLTDPISPAFGADPQGVQTVLAVPSAEVIVAVKDSWKLNRKRADILLVVDTSGSMEGDKMTMVKAGIETFLMRILPEDRLGLITFDSQARLVVPMAPLSENRIDLQIAVQEMRASGRTALFDALDLARQTLEALPPAEDDRIRAIVLLSDGADNASRLTLEEVRRQFDESGITIFPVAYGSDADRQVLDAIAEFSRTIVVVGDSGDIAQIFENLSRYF
ncbi:MAG TPA: VWA domain-containing protein [Chloroflexus aurantiacus]|uniref:von Willebrand factor type A n=1 Tax=Chloroflexus aurantiacus (strain ATCC 29366 / DSM 635 / J-10-fl) TaxID=324602 RepID=A9WK46_CHLAA|nr:VWA domain-containing protein [Chloroflexus aurantiacus]ABY34497.1 von Willebrand factor type A [Chloroflexus aurantiacus J-10-fl]HBW66559.1 VWA domain-containing protein [Chloroflexus aurantiacus]